jgi:hypothetical protein
MEMYNIKTIQGLSKETDNAQPIFFKGRALWLDLS